MAIGDVIGTAPGPWWFDKDGNGTKSDKYFTIRSDAEDAGKAAKEDDDFAALQALGSINTRGGRG